MARPWGSIDSNESDAARGPVACLLVQILAGLPAEATNATTSTPLLTEPRTERRPRGDAKEGYFQPFESHD